MKKSAILLLLMSTMLVLSGCHNEEEFVLIKGDNNITDFYMGVHEVTQQEWQKVMGNNPSQFKGKDLPVESISWYDSVLYCNMRSLKEGLTPYYNIDKENFDPENICEYDDLKWTVTINENANGYRLPTVEEWEYVASGGAEGKANQFSGSDNIDEVAWYWKNSGEQYLEGEWNWNKIEANKNITHNIKKKAPNTLGLYDMSGNVREWCWDWYGDIENPFGFYRTWKGGGIIGDARCCEIAYKGKFEPNGVGYDQGLRLCKNKST